MRAILLNGPIRTGRGTCHERALRFGRREAPIRCGFARTYVPSGLHAGLPHGLSTQRGHYNPGRWIALGEIRLARIHDRWVGEDVHERRLAARKGPLQSGTQLVWPLYELAVSAQRPDHLVIAQPRLQVGGHGVAVEELHRVFLERPDAVVAHHADDGDAVTDERVELEAREAEGAVAEQQADLALRVRDLGGKRRARAGAEAAIGARVHPATGLVGLDHASGERDEVAPVADHHGVAVQHLGKLAVHAHGVQRRAVVGEVVLLRRALLVLHGTQAVDPGRAVGAARRAQRVEAAGHA